MSCELTQQICEELGSRDALGSSLRKATPTLPATCVKVTYLGAKLI